jgi:hypothetical protein
MKMGTKTLLGLFAIGAGVLMVAIFATRKRKNPYSPSTTYDVDNLYTLPEGVTEVSTGTIPKEMVDAVHWVYVDFVLSRAYADDAGNTYLVEEHKGFDPLVFLVTPKEMA